jgi:creatinine amidohydrolase
VAPTGPIRDARDYRARFPDGRIGSDPSLATPEAGGRIVALAAQALCEELGAFAAAGGFGLSRARNSLERN